MVLLAARAFVRNYDWFSDVTLWRSAIKVSPRSFRCYQSLAFAIFEENGLQWQRGIPSRSALEHADEMISIAEGALPIVSSLPDRWNSSRLYLHLGMYYSIKGDLLSQRGPDGDLVLTDANRPWFAKAAHILETASRIDRAFDGVNYERQIERGDKPADIYDVGLTPIYDALAKAYYKLGMWRESANALRYELQLEPGGANAAEPYFRLALANIRQGRYDDAASALISCLLLDGRRQDAWATLAQIYGAFGERMRGAMEIDANSGYRLNFNHPVVRANLLDAHRDIIRTLIRANRRPAAEQMRAYAVKTYGFPRAVFDLLFEEDVPRVTPQGPEYVPKQQRGAAALRAGAKNSE
jgi:tetratricopeptide (TPR) repeat protein